MSDHADPDPDEPWRYACRCCGSVSVDANRFHAGVGVRDDAVPYRCQSCGHGDTRVRDRRTGDAADPRNLSRGGAVDRAGTL